MFEEAGAGNVDGYIDRAHRIGKTYFDKKSSKKCKSIIVKLGTFRHRTIVYRLKKNMKDNIKVHVDLTEKRCNLLKSGSNLVNDVDRILFCYADINCGLKIKLKDEPREDDFFTSIDDLEGHVDLFIHLFILSLMLVITEQILFTIKNGNKILIDVNTLVKKPIEHKTCYI